MYIIKSKPSNHAPSHPKGREPRLLMRSRDPKHRPAPLAVADNLLLVFLFIQGGNEGAREALKELWKGIGDQGKKSPIKPSFQKKLVVVEVKIFLRFLKVLLPILGALY